MRQFCRDEWAKTSPQPCESGKGWLWTPLLPSMAQGLIRFGGQLLFTHGRCRPQGFAFREWSCHLMVACFWFFLFGFLHWLTLYFSIRFLWSGTCKCDKQEGAAIQGKVPPGFTIQIQDQCEGLERFESSQNVSLNIMNFKWALMSLKNWFNLEGQWAALEAIIIETTTWCVCYFINGGKKETLVCLRRALRVLQHERTAAWESCDINSQSLQNTQVR